jgi:ribonucleotide reductase alpha subunit
MEKEYNEKDLISAGLTYFENDSLASDVWAKKYALKKNGKWEEGHPTETIQRMIDEFYRMELKFPNPLPKETIQKHLEHFKYFIPGGSILFGLGNKHQVSSLGNCFFIDNGADSYGAIFNIDESMVQLMKRRGGVGITLENLRPSQAEVNNAAQTSTGAVSFMDRYSHSTREVAQDGRRGALMLSMHINHPDIKQFIVKKDDLTKVTGANVSVKVTDEFMKAVEGDADYILRWPVQNDQPLILDQLVYNKLYKREDGSYIMKVKAREVWDLLIKQAHKTAEPGVLFWDNIIKESPADCYASDGFTTKGTNPCVVGDTLIAVADGRNAVSIKQLTEEGKDVPVYSSNPETGQTEIKWGREPRLTKKNVEVWKLKLDDGSELIATPDHQILTSKLNYKQLKDLTPGESLVPFYSFASNGYRQIARTGAKMIGGAFRNRRQYHLIYGFYNQDENVDHKLYSIHHYDFNNKNDRPENLQKMLRKEHIEFHAARMRGDKNPYYKMSKESKFKFASHPGEKNHTYIPVTNAQILQGAKELFLQKGKFIRSDWRKYAEEHGYPQNIANNFRFTSFDNFKNQVVNNHKVVSVEFYGYEDVYNLTVDDNHNYNVITANVDPLFITSSGISIKNCGEVPLSPYDSCRLGSMNLSNMVKDPYTDKAKIDYALLTEVIRFTQRIMDDLVSLEEEKIKDIIKKIKSDPEDPELKRTELNVWTKVLEVLNKGRRTGIGVLGLGDMLAKLGVRYGTKDATLIIDKVFETIAVNSYRESVQLAKERGCFPIWNADKESQNPFIIRVISNHFTTQEYNDYLRYGRRNIATLSIAPTGSLAILARTTSGIEPVFKCYYKRRRKINPSEAGVKVDYKDENGDCWQEYNVFHPEFINWAKNTKVHLFENFQEKSTDDVLKMMELLSDETVTKLVAESPWAGSESHTIDYMEKVNMQGVIQKWIDHSISVTHNLPQNISIEEVNKIYFQAWKSGCKGCTIYREGSRQGVLLTNKKEEDDFTPVNALKRPRELKADYYVATANGIKYAVIVGLYKDTRKPYEIFAFENPPMDKNTDGRIIKVKKGHYKFVNHEFEIENLQLASDKIEQKAHTIFLSMLLRHRAPIEHIVHVAKKVDENITGFSSVCRRILGKYVETEVLQEKCPECGGNMIREEACVHCDSCSYSKC